MESIGSLFKLEEIGQKKKGEPRNYREECTQWFVDNLKDKKGKKFRFVGIKMKLAHLSDFDVSAFKSDCADKLHRSGQESMQKYFWWALKAK